jgi:hypothetical protein
MRVAQRANDAPGIDLELLAQAVHYDILSLDPPSQGLRTGSKIEPRDLLLQLSQLFLLDALQVHLPGHLPAIFLDQLWSKRTAFFQPFFLPDDCSGKGHAGRRPAGAAIGLGQQFEDFKGSVQSRHGFSFSDALKNSTSPVCVDQVRSGREGMCKSGNDEKYIKRRAKASRFCGGTSRNKNGFPMREAMKRRTGPISFLWLF